MERVRGFEVVTGFESKATIPTRGSANSAGYDFYAIGEITIQPLQNTKTIATGIKCYMPEDEYLQVQVRSKFAKLELVMVNAPGIIDADYYGNSDNEGHIHGMFINTSDKPIKIKKGERFMQGIFQKYFLADGDSVTTKRKGGFGSTGK